MYVNLKQYVVRLVGLPRLAVRILDAEEYSL